MLQQVFSHNRRKHAETWRLELPFHVISGSTVLAEGKSLGCFLVLEGHLECKHF